MEEYLKIVRYVPTGDAGPIFRLKTDFLANVIPEVTNIAVLNGGGNFHFYHFLFSTKSKSNFMSGSCHFNKVSYEEFSVNF